MRQRLLAASLLLLLLLLLETAAAPAADSIRQTRRAVLVLVDGVTFQGFLRDPVLDRLAHAGGVGLLSARAGDARLGPYVTLGAGARATGGLPGSDSAIRPTGRDPISARLSGIADLVAENEGRAVPGLLASTLETEHIGTCLVTRLRYPPRGFLVAMDRRGLVSFVESNCSFEVWDLAHHDVPPGSLRSAVEGLGPDVSRALLIVVEASPTEAMNSQKDELPPILVAEGPPSSLLDASAPAGTVTSDTTRRVGVVSNEDVAPTILDFFGIPIPDEMNGTPIRVVPNEPPPFRLHERHLLNRRESVPIQVGFFLSVTALGLFALWMIVRRRDTGPAAIDTAAVGGLLAVPSVATALLAAGSLPSLTYAWVVPFLVLAGLAGAALGLAVRHRGLYAPAVLVSAGVILFFVVEALRGWPDTLFPFLAGSALDGARFYGLPNVDIGLLTGAGMWFAAGLPKRRAGFAVLVALGLFAGLPDLGANLGGAITLFAAAGLWLAFRSPERSPVMRVAEAVATVAFGAAAVLLANRFLASTSTHISRLASGGERGGFVHTALQRLETGWRLLLDSPFGFIPVLGLFVCLWLAVRAPGPFAGPLQRNPEWRTAMVVLVLAGMVAYVVNDTGVAASGLAFGMALAGLFYLPLAERVAGLARRAPVDPEPSAA